MGHRIQLIIAGLVIAQLFSTAAIARDDLRDMYMEYAAKHYEQLLEARAALEAKPEAEWTAAELGEYLTEALWLVYNGAVACQFDLERLPASLDAESLAGYIEAWPQNPCSGWQPMKVLSVDDDFSPGDLVWQVCPPEFWSIKSLEMNTEHPMSFELSVYAASPEAVEGVDLEPTKYNEWVTVPAGSQMIVGLYTESADITRQKRVDREARLKSDS